ncbi:MAG: NAD(P)H-dependent oxidoreductase [Oscillospiraceae bacterium]|nr:NAD(P)H-dependent oxidoreductase [Oscillospiraceae bacterium]
MNKTSVGILTGSLRRESFSRKTALYLAGLLEERFEVRFFDIAPLEMYNQDLESDPPQSWLRFREQVKAADAVLFVTPEYNRSLPPVLKNAIDIASRPYGANAWSGKPGAVVSISPGGIGGFGANHHLRQVAAVLNIHMLQQPEAYLGGIAGLTDENGIADESAREFLQKLAKAFAEWIDRLA